MKKIVLVGKDINDLKILAKENGEPSFRGEQIFRWIYKDKIDSIEKMSNLSDSFRQKLMRSVQINSITLEKFQTSKIDGTIKMLFKLYDGKKIESVIIPPRETAKDFEKRLTICISTQVGCPLDCNFCATATMGFERNLTSGEIIEQIIIAEKYFNKNITNIVFMGMGEPMLNFENVFKACDIISSQKGMEISPKKITISTAGYADAIKKMADNNRKENLALSLHSLDDAKRTKIMPITKKYSVEKLVDALKYYTSKTKNNIMLEYILFRDFNDTEKDIQLISKLNNLIPLRVNIIPFHDISFTQNAKYGSDLKSADKSEIDSFALKLRDKGVLVFTRNSSGVDIDAACGQLAISSK